MARLGEHLAGSLSPLLVVACRERGFGLGRAYRNPVPSRTLRAIRDIRDIRLFMGD